ncbi:hypothetical protein BJX96DRAFT_10566 [Aspergillus floccosus]
MILAYLSPSDAIQLFLASKHLLLYADVFCDREPHYFYRFSGQDEDESDKRRLILAIAAKLPRPRHRELDLRWEIISKIAEIARVMPILYTSPIVVRSLDPIAPLQSLNHGYGLREIIVQLPEQIEAIDVSTMALDDRHYVCGIGLRNGTTYSFYGHKTEHLQTTRFSAVQENTMVFVQDELGTRSLRWGTCQSLQENLYDHKWWEACSMKQNLQEIRIVHDALKFRQIDWRCDCPLHLKRLSS